MIVVANTDASKWAMYNFLKGRGVHLSRSEDFQAIGRLSAHSQELIGVVAFNNFVGNVCSIHLAGDGNWVSREFIRAVFDYPFRQLSVVAMIAPVPGNNHKALKFDTHFGFRVIHTVRDGWEKGVDLHLLQLRKEDCRWLGKEVKRELAQVA
jgi:RimJ/RimL family protein N-acetyltransferase